MLQQITGEHHIDGIIWEKTKIVGPTFVELDSGLEHAGAVRVQIDADATSRTQVIQEFAVAASQVDHRIAAPDPRLEEAVDEHGPNGGSRLTIVPEAIAVELLKVGVTPHVVLMSSAQDASDCPGVDSVHSPGYDLIQHDIQGRRRGEAEHLGSLVDVGRA